MTRRKIQSELSTTTDRPLSLEEHLPFRVAVLANLLRVDRDPLVRRHSDLGVRELRVLLNLGSYQPTSAADIAYQARLDTPTVSRALKTLAAQGLVATLDDRLDRRRTLIGLTDSGLALYGTIAAILEARAARLAAILEPGELASLMDMLRRLEERAEELLAEEILDNERIGIRPSADQKELLRWYRRGGG